MVSLRSLVVGAVALVAATVNAVATPQQIADGIESITQKAQDLQPVAQSITTDSAPLIVIGQGPFPELIAGFTDIVTTATTLVGQLGTGEPSQRRGRAAAGIARRDAGADLALEAYLLMARVFKVLFDIMVRKGALLEEYPIVQAPVLAALRRLDAAIHTLSFALVAIVPANSGDFKSEAKSLDTALIAVIDQYEALKF